MKDIPMICAPARMVYLEVDSPPFGHVNLEEFGLFWSDGHPPLEFRIPP